jgi:hypothetical protein
MKEDWRSSLTWLLVTSEYLAIEFFNSVIAGPPPEIIWFMRTLFMLFMKLIGVKIVRYSYTILNN